MKNCSLCFCVLLCLAVVFHTAYSDPNGVWTFGDNCDVSWYKSAEFEFTIDSAEKLAGLAKLVNEGKSFTGVTITLGKDIDLGAHYWEPIGTTSSIFEGIFDGGSKMISNVMIDDETVNSGLFGYASGTIQNVHVSGTISCTATTCCTGGVVGFCEGCTISGCTNEAKVSGSGYAGGIAGCILKTSILNSHNKGRVSGTYAGGINGGREPAPYYKYAVSKIKNCFNTGRVSASTLAGGIVGYCKYEYYMITNCCIC